MTEAFESASAIVLAAMLNTSIRRAFPSLEPRDHVAVFLAVIDRMAQAHGFAVRPGGFTLADDDDGEG